MNYYERHLGDYARDTGHLSLVEHGAYSLLLDRYYITEKPIPSALVYRVARARTKEEKRAVDFVLAEFFTLENGEWSNNRADEEIARARKKIHAAQNNGLMGGRPKIKEKILINQCEEEPNGLSLGSENKTQQKAHQTPVNHIKEPPLPPKGDEAKKKSSPVSLGAFIDACKQRGEKTIPDDDPVFDFADKAGIDYDWLRIAWKEFVARHSDGSKRYRDWRRAFRNAVRGNWFKVWYCGPDGKLCLSSQGRTLNLAHSEEA